MSNTKSSYPRTDSRYLTTDMIGTMGDRLQGMSSGYMDEIRPLLASRGKVLAKRVFNNEKVTDHHAIIPTEQLLKLSVLDSDERKLYDLIARRFLVLFLPAYEYETVQAIFKVEGETFTAKETNVIDLGFKKVLGKEETEQVTTGLQKLVQGQAYTIKKQHCQPKVDRTTTALFRSRYPGANGKNSGLGPRQHGQKLLKTCGNGSRRTQNSRLSPTKKGKQSIDLVNDELKSPELTAKWEQELNRFRKEEADPKVFFAKNP